jgi:hypothetical protein
MIEINIDLLIIAIIVITVIVGVLALRPKHNCADHLHVKKHHTVKESDYKPEHFDSVRYHLYCTLCDKDYEVRFAHIRKGVKEFLNPRTVVVDLVRHDQ